MHNQIKELMLEAIQYPRPENIRKVCSPVWNQPFFYKIDKARAITISYNPTDKGARTNYPKQVAQYISNGFLPAEEIFDILYNFKKEYDWRKNYDIIFDILGIPSESIAHMDASFFPYKTFNDFQANKKIDDTYKFLFKTIELLLNQLDYIFIDGAKNKYILNYLIRNCKLIDSTVMSLNSGSKYALSIYKHNGSQTKIVYYGCSLFGRTFPSKHSIKEIANHIKAVVSLVDNFDERRLTINRVDDGLLNGLQQYRELPVELNKTKTLFVLSDIRCSRYELEGLLKGNGFDEQNQSHIILTCGSILTNGYSIDDFNSPLEFLFNLHSYNRLIIIKNNDDESILNAIDNIIEYKDYQESDEDYVYKKLNKYSAISHIATLIGCSPELFWRYRKTLIREFEHSHILLKLKKYSTNYYEIGNYIFVHGGIPIDKRLKSAIRNWRACDDCTWREFYDSYIANDRLEPLKIIVTSHGVEPWMRIYDYRRTKSLPRKDGNHLDIHSDLGTNCVVFKQSSNGHIAQILGKANIGYFWIIDDDILSSKYYVDLDNVSLHSNCILRPIENIIDVWNNLSKGYKKGKYANKSFDYFCYGEVIYDFNTQNSKICFRQFTSGEIVVTEVLFDCFYYIEYSHKKEKQNLNINRIKEAFSIETNYLEFENYRKE